MIPAALATASVVLAADPALPPAATSAQVEKLQAQIEQMGKELEEMKQLVKSAELPRPSSGR